MKIYDFNEREILLIEEALKAEIKILNNSLECKDVKKEK